MAECSIRSRKGAGSAHRSGALCPKPQGPSGLCPSVPSLFLPVLSIHGVHGAPGEGLCVSKALLRPNCIQQDALSSPKGFCHPCLVLGWPWAPPEPLCRGVLVPALSPSPLLCPARDTCPSPAFLLRPPHASLKASSCVFLCVFFFFLLLYSFVMNICHFVTSCGMKGLAPLPRIHVGVKKKEVMHVEVLLTLHSDPR